MPKTKISEFSATPGNNTDIDGINIAEGCAPSGINDAIRELMSQLKDFQAGTAGDSFNGPVGTTTAAAGAFTTLSASSTVSGTGFSTYLASPPAIGGTAAAAGSFTTLSASSTVTLSGGTANGVLYLNGSKVATSGSALTFDGAQLGVNGITVGRGAGAVSTNTAVGASALAANTSGGANTAFGTSALAANTTGIYNNAMGYQASAGLTTGQYNNALGGQALFTSQSGNFNNAVGYQTLYYNTSGSSNTAVGHSAMTFNTTGGNNTAIGQNALASNTTASYNTALGYQAAYANTIGQFNVAVGVNALTSNTSGERNTAIGDRALYASTGSYNTGLGQMALYSNTTASNNTAVGYQAGYSNSTGAQNTFIGRLAGFSLTTGTYNTFLGDEAGYYITTGGKNVILGSYNGNQGSLDIRTASNYIVLSDGDGNPRGFFDNTGCYRIGTADAAGTSGVGVAINPNSQGIRLVSAASTNASETLAMYSTGATAYRFYVNWAGTVYATSTTISSLSDVRLKENVRDLDAGLPEIMALKPRKFDWKEGKGANIKNARGFIAQEFEQVFPDLIDKWKDPAPEGEESYKSVRQDLIPVLVKAIQEQQATITQLKARLDAANL